MNKGVSWIVSLTVVLIVGIGMTLLATARVRSTVTITITNNSQAAIRNLYLAPGNPDDWGPDQLGDAVIAPGSSVTLNNVACEGSSIRVIAEDPNGCFIYKTASCSDNATVTITASDTPDCGNQ